MKAMRRFGLLIGILLIGIIIGHFGSLIALLIVGPLFTLWLSFWDDKKIRQSQYQQAQQYFYETESDQSYHYSSDNY